MGRDVAWLSSRSSWSFNRRVDDGAEAPRTSVHRSCPRDNENQQVAQAEISLTGCRQRPGNALRSEKRTLHTLRSTLQSQGTPLEFRVLEAGLGRNLERGPKLGLAIIRIPKTLGDSGTKNLDAGTNRVVDKMGTGWGHRTKAEPSLERGKSRGAFFQPAPSTFIHPQRLAPAGHRTELRKGGSKRKPRDVGVDAAMRVRVRGPAPSSTLLAVPRFTSEGF